MHRVLLLALALLFACQRLSGEECAVVCWRVNELHYWERFEKEAKGLAPEARDRLKAERQKAWEELRARDFDPGLENCVKECRRAGRPEDIPCVEKATTAAGAQECLK